MFVQELVEGGDILEDKNNWVEETKSNVTDKKNTNFNNLNLPLTYSLDSNIRNRMYSFPNKKRGYSKSYVLPTYLRRHARSVKYSPEQVRKLLENETQNAQKLQEVSRYLWSVSSVYRNYLNDLATTMTFDYLLYPEEVTGKEKEVTLKNRLIDSAKTVRNAQITTNYPMMLLEALKIGEAFYYIQDDGNVIYDLIPNDLCMLGFIDEDNLWRYWVNLALITEQNKVELPEEIKLAHSDWVKNGKSKKITEKIFEGIGYRTYGNYYLVSKKGNAIFCHMKKTSRDVPYLDSMFPDLLTLEENKEFFDDVLKDDNIKTIHFKVPLSNDGFPLMQDEIVREYHYDAESVVGNNVSIITNPFDIEAVNLDKTQQNGINIVKHSSEVVSKDSGASDAKFSAETTNALKYSVSADAAKMFPLRYFFENIMNYRLKKYKYKITILPIHRDNRDEQHTKYKNDLLDGGSRFAWLSTSGIELYEYIKLLELERTLDIDSWLTPKVSGSNMSGNTDVGRPNISDDDKADSTIKVDERK